MMFYKGELYCIDAERIMAYDIQSIYDNRFCCAPWRDVLVHHKDDEWNKTYRDDRPYGRQHFLVESGGELLVVGKYTSTIFYHDHKIRLNVHRVDQEQRRLVPMDGLGDHRMLFVGRGWSQSWSRLMNKVDITREPSKFFTENWIYFLIPMVSLYLNKAPPRQRAGGWNENFLRTAPGVYLQHGKYWPVWISSTYPNWAKYLSLLTNYLTLLFSFMQDNNFSFTWKSSVLWIDFNLKANDVL